MKKLSLRLALTMTVFLASGWIFHFSRFGVSAHLSSARQDLNAAAPEAAKELVKAAGELEKHDRPEEAVAALKQALSIAPHYLRAHLEYVRIKIYHLDRYDELRAEYESLLAREPDEPVYLMALALAEPLSPKEIRLARFKKVSEIVPEWAWAHFARARLIQEKQPEAAVTELMRCLEKDPDAAAAYEMLLELQERRLGKIEAAISTAERMTTNPLTRKSGLGALWRLSLTRAQGSEDSKAKLRSELSELTSSSSDVNTLSAVREAYSSLLADVDHARSVERRILEVDPTWYPYRGETTSQFALTSNGLSRHIVAINRQSSIVYALVETGGGLGPKERMAGLEKLFSLGPKPNLRYWIYTMLLSTAENAGDTAAIVKYGEALRASDPSGPIWSAKIALALAEQKKDLKKALRYARFAEKATANFQLPPRPVNTNPDWIKNHYSKESLQENYHWKRSLALDALGWVYFRIGKYHEAEANLRRAVELYRTEKNLSRLSGALAKLGRTQEAEKVALDAKHEYAAAIRREFTNEPVNEFQLTTIDGRKIKLSDLKGKVIMLNFWATWCGPCTNEAPLLVRLYEQYKNQAFEILAISGDVATDHYKVNLFAKEHKYAFPVLFDDGVEKLYKIPGYPTSVFIDRQGKVRYRDSGYYLGVIQKFDVVIRELLKS